MGTGESKITEGSSHGSELRGDEKLDLAGGQLYVSLKMEIFKLKADLVPHVYGSVPFVGSSDPSQAVITFTFYSLNIAFVVNHSLRFHLLFSPSMACTSFLWSENRLLRGN